MHRWNLSAFAAAIVVSAAMTPTDASALALGRIDVQSALGEPLRAEIDIPLATPAELEALRAGIASPDIFRAQGMEFTGTARQVLVEVARRADGSPYLRLHSQAPINDPYVDLVIDANWAAGKLVRSYTLLLDPPASQRTAPAVTTAPQISTPAPAPLTPAVTGRTYSSDGAAPAPENTAKPAPAPRVTRSIPAANPGAEGGSGNVTVRRGDTAGRIASANRHAGVSLDQMLVAMLRANPNAFINGNVNRLRAGSVVQMPSRDEALSTPANEARQIVAAQSRDFNEFRRRLATQAPAAKVAAADRTASGQVKAQVQDNAAPAPAADKLTLSKGALSSQSAADEKLAQDKQASAQTERMNELQRNLAELKQVAASTPVAGNAPAGVAPTAPASAETSSAPALNVPVAPPPSAESSPSAADTAPQPAATTEAATPAETASSPVPPANIAPAAPAPSPQPAPATEPAPGFMEELTGDNPMLLPAAGGIVALLLGLLGWRTVQRRKALAASQAVSDTPLETPDSLFEASGGQQVDTHQSTATAASTMAYSPSQLDAGGDVDPVAEAEVYLAYGRDVQAEEILKEALRSQPERLGVHLKLAEIYAKRKDPKAFAPVALAVQELTQATGPQWEHVQELGYTLDPANPLYQSSSKPAPAAPSTSAFAEALAKSTQATAAAGAGAATAAAVAAPNFPADLDLSLDMDLPGGLSDQPSPSVEGPASVMMPSEQDFAALEPTLDMPVAPVAQPATSSVGSQVNKPVSAPPAGITPVDLDVLELDTPAAGTAEATPVKPITAPETDPDITLDFGGLNLDLDTPSPAPAPVAAPPTVADDPLATKLDLAREFHAIGDSEGARTLVEEVIAEASGDLKERAQLLLSEID